MSIKLDLSTFKKNGGVKKIQRIEAGSESVKYLITANNNRRFLLKIYYLNNERNVQLDAEINRRMIYANIKTPIIFETGRTNKGVLPYELMEWVPGISMDILLGTIPEYLQYKKGIAAGRLIKKIHELDYHKVCEPKHLPTKERVKYAVARFDMIESTDQPTYKGSAFRDYLLKTYSNYSEKNICLLHGDYHVGNIIEGKNEVLWVIDWTYNLIGDPIEDFARIFVSANKSPEFAKGQIDGYFGGNPPLDFWHRLKMYAALQQLEILSFPLGKLKDGKTIQEHQHELVYEQYQGMLSIIPLFYINREENRDEH